MTTQKNGTTIPPNGKKVETTVTLTPVKKLEEQKPATKLEHTSDPANLPPLEDRVLKIQQLTDLVTKRDKLRESLKSLQSINTSSEGRNLKIQIEDNENDWETFNTDAIKFCVDNLISAHKDRIAILEAQIRW